jgi:hypothetical protein
LDHLRKAEHRTIVTSFDDTRGEEDDPPDALRLRSDVGVMVIEDDQTRLALFVDVENDWKRIHFRLSGGQDSGVGGGVIDTVSITRSLTADASRWLGRHTEGTIRLGIIGNTAAPTLPTDPSVRVVSYEADAGLAHQLSRWLALHLDYSYLIQRSSGIAVAGQRHLVSANLTATAPQWRSGR